MSAAVGGIGEMVARVVSKMLTPSVGRLDELEQRVHALEARRGIAYRGVWGPVETYFVNDVITFQGSMWIALSGSTAVRPGDGRAWQLCVKRGRDGRDLR